MREYHSPPSDEYVLHRRFDRIGRLVGDQKMAQLFRSHVMVIGLGGVGSWAVEALARSGVGRITLVDFDDICITNSNRQLHALTGLVGQKKALVLADRLRKINPSATVESRVQFYNSDSSNEILDCNPEYLIDAIDNVTAKCHLLATCLMRKIPVVSVGGSGGRLDPLCLQMADMAETHTDPLLQQVRKILRTKYSFPSKGLFGIPTVFSAEEPTLPEELKYDKGQGFRCVCPQGANNFHSCEKRNLIYGTAAFVTGAFGLAAAGYVVRALVASSKFERHEQNSQDVCTQGDG